MTVILSGEEIAEKITARFPEAVVRTDSQSIELKSDYLVETADYLKKSPETALKLLDDITAVDYHDYFELVYRLTSIEHNKSAVLKVRCYDRNNPQVPSVISVWQGADFMEREIYDLMGIFFTGHPNMKRIFLWEGFEGHPLRKDYL